MHNWHGHVWLNPPYSRQLIRKFIAKLCNERTAGRVTAAIMLTHNYTDTEWFHQAVGAADAICFTRGRVKFFGPDGRIAEPMQGQAFFLFRRGREPIRRTIPLDRTRSSGELSIPQVKEHTAMPRD